MNLRFIPIAVTAVALLLGTNPSLALENDETEEPATVRPPKSEATKRALEARRRAIAAERAAAAKIKPVDLNNATSEQLKKLPGIGDAQAAKIIAGRPYNSKALLVTENIIDTGIYGGIRDLVIVKPPRKNVAKNAASPEKKK